MVDELLAQLRAWGPSVFTLPMAHVEVGASVCDGRGIGGCAAAGPDREARAALQRGLRLPGWCPVARAQPAPPSLSLPTCKPAWGVVRMETFIRTAL